MSAMKPTPTQIMSPTPAPGAPSPIPVPQMSPQAVPSRQPMPVPRPMPSPQPMPPQQPMPGQPHMMPQHRVAPQGMPPMPQPGQAIPRAQPPMPPISQPMVAPAISVEDEFNREGGDKALPQISIHAFCDRQETAGVINESTRDWRMKRTNVKIYMGGLSAAIEFYHKENTPGLVLIESGMRGPELFSQLEELA